LFDVWSQLLLTLAVTYCFFYKFFVYISFMVIPYQFCDITNTPNYGMPNLHHYAHFVLKKIWQDVVINYTDQ
jgi:hypothetical protein